MDHDSRGFASRELIQTVSNCTAYESAPADAARLLAVSNQACAASADPSSSTGDNATVSLDSPEIAHDRFRQANSLQNALTNVELQERLNHLKGCRLWVAKRAKSHAELDESTAAARAGREKDGASAALEGTDEQVRHIQGQVLTQRGSDASALRAENPASGDAAATVKAGDYTLRRSYRRVCNDHAALDAPDCCPASRPEVRDQLLRTDECHRRALDEQ